MTVEADHLRQKIGREQRRARRFLLKNDLEQDRARNVFAGLGIQNTETSRDRTRSFTSVSVM
jgi:hypothetical protein